MIYEFKCPKCNFEFEVDKPLADESPEECPKGCEDVECTRLISTTSFTLKGGGWFNSGGY